MWPWGGGGKVFFFFSFKVGCLFPSSGHEAGSGVQGREDLGPEQGAGGARVRVRRRGRGGVGTQEAEERPRDEAQGSGK